MKVLIVHDKNGNIKHLALPAKGLAGQIGYRSKRGRQVAEIEMPDINEDITDEKNLETLIEIATHYRIDLSNEKPKLVRKKDSK